MSVINRALSQAAESSQTAESSQVAEKQPRDKPRLEAAVIPSVKRSSKLAWALGGAALSLCIGVWGLTGQGLTGQALTSQQEQEAVESPDRLAQNDTAAAPQQQPVTKPADQVSETDASQQVTVTPDSTAKVPGGSTDDDMALQVVPKLQQETEQALNSAATEPDQAVVEKAAVEKSAAEKPNPVAAPTQVNPAEPKPRQSKPLKLAGKPVSTAADSVAPQLPPPAKPDTYSAEAQQSVAQSETVQGASGQLRVRQVELSPEQVARRAVERARRALDGNDLTTAIKEYETALKYRPVDDQSRKRLAALYFGRQDIRNAVETLRKGIRIQQDNQALRIALSRILTRQQQPEAALSPLRHLPPQPQVDYLSLRAALAQQVKQTEIALESYQLLVEREGDNARWWLGLGIAHERLQQYDRAKQAYRQALGRIGVSQKTQAFIRDRLALIARLQGEQSAD